MLDYCSVCFSMAVFLAVLPCVFAVALISGGLRFACVQKIPAGLSCLAVVRKFDRTSVSLYLPHGLLAVARAVDVNPVVGSRGFSTRLPAADSSDSDADDGVPAADSAASLLTPGQYVSCVVLRAPDAVASASPAGDSPKAPPVSVSLHPTLVNDGVEFDQLKKGGSPVWGFVASKEDHGFVVELGISGVHAFLPFKNVVGGPAALLVGSPAFFSIAAVKKSASSVVLSYDSDDSERVCASAGSLSLMSLKPGVLVSATVKKVRAVLMRIVSHAI
jgi:rRNA biogenesis protein RRP5